MPGILPARAPYGNKKNTRAGNFLCTTACNTPRVYSSTHKAERKNPPRPWWGGGGVEGVERLGQISPCSFKIYSRGLLNCLFHAPYTNSELLEKPLGITRLTAATYLERLAELGLLEKAKIWRHVYFSNTRLYDLFANTTPAR